MLKKIKETLQIIMNMIYGQKRIKRKKPGLLSVLEDLIFEQY